VADLLVQAARLGVAGVQGLQPRYNVFHREAEESLFPLARRFGLGTFVYNPIAGGLLSGKYQPGKAPARGTRFTLGATGEVYRARYWNERLLKEAATLKREAERHGMSLVTAAVSWVLANPDVTSAIIGASRVSQVADHLKAPDTALPPALKARLDRVWFDLPRQPPNLDTPRIEDWFQVPGKT
jgi:aryl-alcohol dehydrogenase-like predicted oxidoreductase